MQRYGAPLRIKNYSFQGFFCQYRESGKNNKPALSWGKIVVEATFFG